MDNKTESLFFLAISPLSPLQELIHEVKEDIRQKYGIKGAFRSPAHITLQMPFKKKLNKLNKLIDDLLRFSSDQSSFPLQLNGYGAFEPRVLFIKVVENSVLEKLQHALQKLLKSHQIFDSTYRGHAFYPHITVAFRDLKREQFYPLWDEYKHKEFNHSFNASGISLYFHNGQKWELHSFFPFS